MLQRFCIIIFLLACLFRLPAQAWHLSPDRGLTLATTLLDKGDCEATRSSFLELAAPHGPMAEEGVGSISDGQRPVPRPPVSR